MSLLDVFFKAAVPFVVVSVVAATALLSRNRVRGVYRGAEGAARRDAVNRTYRTNTGSVVIAVIFLGIWGMVVADLVGRWGAVFFTFVVSVLLLLPFSVVCACAILLYTLAVHGWARTKDP